MKHLFTIILIFCFGAAWADQTATTEDGRKVILKSDGTWEYVKEPPPPPPVPAPPVVPAAPVVPKESPPTVNATVPENTPKVVAPAEVQTGSLSFEAAVRMKPIEDGTFYLLNDDLNHILQSSSLKSEKKLSLLNTFLVTNYRASLGIERSAKTFASIMESIKPHIIATTTSDSTGKGQFSSIVPGTYYLMNVSVIYSNDGTLIDRTSILWNQRVRIQSGENSIKLDEKNAVQ